MGITVKTNLSSLMVQQNLSSATEELNKAIQRMTTGYKINNAKDNAAGLSIATNWTTKLGSIEMAQENTNMGLDLLSTMEENYSLLVGHLQRLRDLTEQAANGTYDATSKNAIKAEIDARLAEMDRICDNCEYNGIKLLDGTYASTGIVLQVGTSVTAGESQITIDKSNFTSAKVATLLTEAAGTFSTNCIDASKVLTQMGKIDSALSTVSTRITNLGAYQNRLNSANASLTTEYQNVTSSLSTIKDSDVASESSKYVSSQILQQAAATLLATANQAPSIALSLI